MKSNDYKLKQDLCLAYHVLAELKLDDLTYTHLSARPKGANYYYIYPFGMLFSEVKPEVLLKVNFQGEILEGQAHMNPTGYVIHASVYKHRPDINAIFHLHTQAGVSISSLKCGLLPISQWALHFYQGIAYHPYQSLALKSEDHERALIADLGQHFVMFLQNHGTLSCGKTIAEALFYTHHLEKACVSQLQAMACQTPLNKVDHETCQATKEALLNFEPNLGERDWLAWQRYIFLTAKKA